MKNKKIKDPTKQKMMLRRINKGVMMKFYGLHLYLTTCPMKERKRSSAKEKKNVLRLIRIRKINELCGCELCGKELDMRNSELHHIKPISLYPELKLDPENLMLLCHECHVGLHRDVTAKAYELLSPVSSDNKTD